ncbi:UNVERIFIED_CONTAM: putative pectinesterase/pectinesterase inhibitor 54 [Sesamum radiatum]|uniref:Pectinesterase n=1 Tax=Sesamum radiatum TaxID=300843 RepID=A0AAW2L9W3_SESRA
MGDASPSSLGDAGRPNLGKGRGWDGVGRGRRSPRVAHGSEGDAAAHRIWATRRPRFRATPVALVSGTPVAQTLGRGGGGLGGARATVALAIAHGSEGDAAAHRIWATRRPRFRATPVAQTFSGLGDRREGEGVRWGGVAPWRWGSDGVGWAITGDGFIARDIGFENTAGAEGHQAVALTVSSDNSVLFRCSIAGYQDTLYALALRQFYRECDIYGTVDFIFGNAAAVFQSCNLVLRRPRSGGAFNAILANGRSDPGQNTGFSVQNCKITVGSDFSPVRDKFNSYLGRPWKPYSRAVVMQSNIDGEISARGWVEWEGAGGSTYKTLYFAEYENMGPGAGTSGRVNWAGFQVIGTPEATKFTVASFIGGNSWLPSTGVTFVAGLH